MKSKHSYIAASVRGICLSVSAIIVFSLIGLTLRIAMITDFALFKGVNEALVFIFATAVFPLIFNSFALAVAVSLSKSECKCIL